MEERSAKDIFLQLFIDQFFIRRTAGDIKIKAGCAAANAERTRFPLHSLTDANGNTESV